ncbi:MAG: hypothetical protein V4649_09660 [Bacteroidota bacterium]
MNTSGPNDIRRLAKNYIDRADDITVKMILAMLNVQESERENEDADFDKEMNRRFDEYETGKIIPLSLDELENRVRSSYKKSIQSRK